MFNLIKFQIRLLLKTKLFLIITILTILFSFITLSLSNNESTISMILGVIPLLMFDLLVAISTIIHVSN